MRHVGIFLGVVPHAGGMFQYAQAMLGALVDLPSDEFTLHVVYGDPNWAPVLQGYPRLQATKLTLAGFGQKLATAMMVTRLPVGLTRQLSRTFNPIDGQLRRLNCDYWLFPAQDAIGYQANVPSVVTIHDLMHRYEGRFPEVSGRGRYKIREHRFSSLAATALHVLVDSAVGKDHVCAAYGTSRFKVSALPYIPPSYIYDTAEPDDFGQRQVLPEKYIFYPAQFWAHKNHRRLLDAAARLHEEGTHVCLVFSGGKSNEFENVKRHAEELGLTDSVAFLGYVPDNYLRGLYMRALGMIMPTAFGPTNIPPLEAFVCGCPTAVSGIYGMPEQTGGAALLFDPESTEEIASAMRSLWNDETLRQRLSEAGLERARAWGKVQFADRLYQILKQLPLK